MLPGPALEFLMSRLIVPANGLFESLLPCGYCLFHSSFLLPLSFGSIIFLMTSHPFVLLVFRSVLDIRQQSWLIQKGNIVCIDFFFLVSTDVCRSLPS